MNALRRGSAASVALMGLAAGILSGLLGVGGGIVMVPLLVLVASYRQHDAHATSLAAIIPIASVAALRYALGDSVDYGLAALAVAGSLVGAPLGARLMARTPEASLKMLFGLLLLGVSVQMLWP